MIEGVFPVSSDLLLFFVIGLLGGAHCIGMCGPLVTIYAGKMRAQQGRHGDRLTLYDVRQHALFNLGRTASYATIGGVCGAVGATLYLTTNELTAAADVLRGSAGTGIGLVVVFVGVYYLLGRTDPGISGAIPGVGGLFGTLSTKLDGWATGPGIVGLGALHGLLPCPILYPAFLYAFAVGSPLNGFLSLGALGLGTLPAVFLYGTLIESVDPTRRRQLHRVLGVAFVLLGYILFAHGMMAFGIQLPHPRLPHWQPLAVIGG